MYLLDYVIPKYLNSISNSLHEEFIEWLESKEVVITNQTKDLSYKAVCCFVKNTVFVVSKGKDMVYIPRKKMVYSLPLIYNGTKVNRKVSHKYTMLLCDFLVFKKDCFMSYGGVFWEFDLESFKKSKGKIRQVKVGDKFTSAVKLPPALIDLFTPLAEKSDSLPLSVMDIRDEDGNLISKKLTEKQKDIIRILTKLNLSIIENEICLHDNKLDFSVKKIYNNSSYQYGGRNYLVGTNSQQAQSAATRLEITINKEPCVELDYKHLHPSILADLAGVTFPDNYDPYGIEFEGMDKSLLRAISKKGLLMIINTDNPTSAMAALSSALTEEPLKSEVKKAKAEGKWPEGRVVHTIIDKLIEHNGYLMNTTGPNTGLELMNIESQMCDIVIERVLLEDEILIPLHDGFIVQRKNEDMLRKIMFYAYDSVIGGNNCKVSSKVAKG